MNVRAYRFFIHLFILIPMFIAMGCRTVGTDRSPLPGSPVSVSYRVISDSVTADPGLEKIVETYRIQLDEKVSEVIGTATETLTKDSPEGALGNFAADALLEIAREASGIPVDFALTNNGGLRVPIVKGSITVGDMFELMPFENALVVLTLTGVQVDSLIQELAREGGEPIAGLSFKIAGPERIAEEIFVRGEPLDRSREYRVATSDYLADGGGRLRALLEPVDRKDTGVTLRDAFIRYVRKHKVITPYIDRRIVIEQ